MINLGDAMLADQQKTRVKQAVELAYQQAARPKDMAAFIRHESAGRLHCEVKIYFSPASAEVAAALGAQTCERPSPFDLGWFVGSNDAWQALFPEKS